MRSRPPQSGVAGNSLQGSICTLGIRQRRPQGKHAVAGAPAPLDLLGRGHRWPGAIKIDAELRAAILWREAGAP